MLLKEVLNETGLTRKALDYYVKNGLVHPEILENGYREFSSEDANTLKQVDMYRKLGITLSDIKRIINGDSERLKEIALQTKMDAKTCLRKSEILSEICDGKNIWEYAKELRILDMKRDLAERLVEIFPGFYGRFICMHYANFLNCRCRDEKAFGELIVFLDSLEDMNLDPEREAFLEESQKELSEEILCEFDRQKNEAVNDPEGFLDDNAEIIEEYMKYMQSEDYKNSKAFRLKEAIKDFCQKSGYYEKVIPLMRKISPDYDEYYIRLEKADEIFKDRFRK